MNATDVPSAEGLSGKGTNRLEEGDGEAAHISIPRDLEQSYFSFLHVKI